MSKQPSITINIPNPCTQDWDAMTPTSNGRHCDSCQQTVIDFTTWSDTALYNFFARNKGHVCGRYLASQVDRPIHIPYQPHSRLYRMVVAMGLTLLFAQTPVHAQQQAPRSAVSVANNGDSTKHSMQGYGEIKGIITDDRINKEPLVNASVTVNRNGIAVGGAATDFDGNFLVGGLDNGNYEVKVSYIGYEGIIKSNVIVEASKTTLLDIALHAGPPGMMLQIGGISARPSPHHKKKAKKHHNGE